jgi:pimeloyl-ACP methyl ester carboxylesterase
VRGLPKLADKPALIFWGTRDFAFKDEELARFERTFARHRTIRLDNASHFLQEDAGERIADEIRLFLNEIVTLLRGSAPTKILADFLNLFRLA